ncbi:hypothetical protein ALI44B_00200 [Leifsonia sp. ALI-44-B]|uniref:hypothetical protein n=1 Tax=Leifsonia sp. ALI-44-B TaxID=1933776 RepID=UPI00097C2DE8|nr:hypothetical protein [Leifsonia sp. ALI-44-B]ONI65414.1 hypothetical protein ALI44B_00200 [Leifsonia sp. ALI-44-B]
MNTYEFTITLNRVPVEEDFDRLYEAGLDDSTPEVRDGRGVLNVHREAESLSAAILSTVADIERAGFEAVSIADEDLVSLKTVAQRLGRTYESVRLLATGQRGSGNFPAPLSGDGWALYSWAQVSDWVDAQKPGGVVATVEAGGKSLEDARVIAAASQLLRARAIASPEAVASLIPLALSKMDFTALQPAITASLIEALRSNKITVQGSTDGLPGFGPAGWVLGDEGFDHTGPKRFQP